MNFDYLILVGDDYEVFADQENVITVSGFYEKILDNSNWPDFNTTIILGQGISYHDRDFISSTLSKRNMNTFLTLPPVASLEDTHKRSDENILITQSRKLGKLHYGFELSITDKIDRLSDHVTGKHVGAMLLMEAVRQATIAALEQEYCKKSDEKFSLVLERFDSQFSNYLFPVPATLETIIHEKVTSKNISVVVKTIVTQANTKVAEVNLDVALWPSQVLDKIESRRAQTIVTELHRINAELQPLQLHSA